MRSNPTDRQAAMMTLVAFLFLAALGAFIWFASRAIR